MLSPGGSSGALALALAVVAFLASMTANYLSLGPSFVNTPPRQDSLQYLRDALIVQHRIFDLPDQPGEYVGRYFQERGLQLPNRGDVSLRFGNRPLFLLFNAIVLQLANGSIAAVYFANLVMVALAAALAAYVLGREVGFVGSSAFIFFLFFYSNGSQIDTIMIEPMFSLVLVIMALGAWLVLRQSLGGTVLLMIVAILAPLVKGSLLPFAVLGVMLCGAMLVARYWQRKGLGLAVCAGAVFCVLLTVSSVVLIKHLLVSTGCLNEQSSFRSNAGYALWMGSLPTMWTGAYSGRINTQTHRYGYEEGANTTFKEQMQRVSGYYLKLQDVVPLVLDNYGAYPMDALARIAFKYTKMVGVNGFRNTVHVWAGNLALLGCVVIALAGRAAMVPWVVALQGMLWTHTLSRYRPRDNAQIVVLVLFLSLVGLVWLLSRVFRAKPWSEQFPSIPRWVGWGLAGIVTLPLLLALVFPDTQSLKPPSIKYMFVKEENAHLKVRAMLEEPEIFARVRLLGEGSSWVDQANQKGWVSFDVPWNKCAHLDSSQGDGFKLVAWSRTGIEEGVEINVDCEGPTVKGPLNLVFRVE